MNAQRYFPFVLTEKERELFEIGLDPNQKMLAVDACKGVDLDEIMKNLSSKRPAFGRKVDNIDRNASKFFVPLFFFFSIFLFVFCFFNLRVFYVFTRALDLF